MYSFSADAQAGLGGPPWLAERRAAALEALEGMALPSEKEEVWRYSPIDELDLSAYAPVPPGGGGAAGPGAPELAAFVASLRADLGAAAAVVVTRGGDPVSLDTAGLPDGCRVGAAATGGLPRPGAVLTGGDALVRLNDAFAPDVVAIEVADGADVTAPVVVVHWCDEAPLAGSGAFPASFPRCAVRVGARARAAVVEVLAGPGGSARSLVVPVTELEVADGGHLRYVGLQVLGLGAWSIGRLSARVGAGARLASFTVGLGADYDRLRTDAVVVGAEGVSEVRSAYLGTGRQVHDIRTLQDHDAPRSTSDLLCTGAVAGHSRSVYTGLIRVRHGAVRSEAMQTNHNLVLDEDAHADSVPNLDIAENDVRCSHASTIGPVDEDQRYYLESRGVPPVQAERLIVLGFFDDIIERAPVAETVPWLRREVNGRLAAALGPAPGENGGPADG